MIRAPRATVALATVAALLAGCTGAGDDTRDDAPPLADAAGGEATGGPDDGTHVAEAYTGDDFYAVPEPLPDGGHGDLIRYEPITDSELEGGTQWRVMYLSESVAGEPIAVTGTVAIPDDPPPPDGRDLVTVAHGTTGIADECAPSLAGGPASGAVEALGVARGYVVATSDYEGLGTPGRHPYLVGESEGRSVLDAALAAAQVPDAELGERVAIAGYSQGGHGALWAGELAAEWTPELDVVGTFAGAPATELPVIFAAAGSLPIAGFLYMIIAGFEAAYPDEADPSLLLTPAGLEALVGVDDGCAGEVLARLAGTPSDELLVPDAATVEPWATLAAENDPGQVVAPAPVLIVHSSADEVVPATLSQLLFDRMCGLGQQVERRVYEDGQGHGEAAPQAYLDGFEWIDARFAGEPAISTCA